MNSRIEQIIEDLEDYIDSCKYQMFSSTKIIVDKEAINELVAELGMRVPEEIKKCQKIVSQQDAILKDAQSQAQNMLNDAQTQIDSLINEHEVMQRAYQRANEVVEEARQQADEILNSAYMDAGSIREGAIQYTDNLLARVQAVISANATESRSRLDDMFASLEAIYNECTDSRQQLENVLSGNAPAEAPENTDET